MAKRRTSVRRRGDTQNDEAGNAAAASPAPSTSESLPSRVFSTLQAWETWLEANHASGAGMWLKLAKKGCDTPSVSYSEALDAALCFGWIDSQKKACDADFFLQKFGPRRPRSLWSRRNVDRVAVLREAGRMRAPGEAEVEAATTDGRWEAAYASPSAVQVPPDFAAALAGDKRARQFFDTLNKTQRYSFLWRIETAKKADTRQRRIRQFVEMLSEHKTLH